MGVTFFGQRYDFIKISAENINDVYEQLFLMSYKLSISSLNDSNPFIVTIMSGSRELILSIALFRSKSSAIASIKYELHAEYDFEMPASDINSCGGKSISGAVSSSTRKPRGKRSYSQSTQFRSGHPRAKTQ